MTERTTCAVVGGGPAGMVLGLLLARAGVEVTVLEKHGDFLRDFRGDTVHASTVRLLDELGLGSRFREIPQSKLETIGFPSPDGDGIVTFGELRRLRAPYNYIAMVPQWDFLDLLADAGAEEPTFTLRMNTEVTGLLRDGERVTGVQYRTRDGVEGELHADLTVACDGRHSLLRDTMSLRPKEFGVPFDVLWFRVPRDEKGGDVSGITGKIDGSNFMVMINRGDYFQNAYFIKKGTDAQVRAEGIERFRERVAAMAPEVADRVDAIESMDEVKMLDVKLNRLHRWHSDGLLLIGDAAHAMSPLGGVGVNVAVQDAVAAARLLAEPLRRKDVRTSHLAAVRRRRWLATAATQRLQRTLQENVVGPLITGERKSFPKALITVMRRLPFMRAVPAYMVGIGLRPEHAPEFARRPDAKAGSRA
ncbi:2-polyprenyl-6-methoxyphenol hydroxylase-like FAD-dependent oxidoreductase [Herbihabitans rhizosphaerae]|uniref:2-polyprenyl-6-methoxyphenol hydroxylase-like FAD-dependent oxidoreductase n=1 Tax=Herbihabitans rhizosphaerae TaxID=1872711 RepID=A0A4Q7KQI4_9PSEU|nr:FAD-dependent oxidoreductase [Herbihabitans rhizosphaerae]RZS39098.1 2-polyprenyl-6-methoxyphenol hydroxylase-like FAD-dependent oxidoreductase [Herbihabitans rhizosphaerae]